MQTEDLKKFWVVAVISNSVRYKKRVELFKRFQLEMKQAGAQLIVVELAYGQRPYEVTDSKNRQHLQLRSQSEIWHKENMINLGVRRLSEVAPDWEYFAFIDADISFVPSHHFADRQNWINETVHQLQHHNIVQMFQTAIDLGPTGEAFGKYDGFAWAYVEGKFNPNTYKYTSFHPGYAWAMRRELFNNLSGLIETAILGAGDRHMAYSLVGMVEASIHPGLSPNYATNLIQWQTLAERFNHRDLGYVQGTILHYWHGKKSDRRYHDRWAILVNNQYDPTTDLRRNDQGLLELVVITPRQIKLRDDIRKYFRARNEDSIDAG